MKIYFYKLYNKANILHLILIFRIQNDIAQVLKTHCDLWCVKTIYHLTNPFFNREFYKRLEVFKIV